MADTETELSVRGMTCQNCVRHVEKAVRSVPGVQNVSVDLARGSVRVTHAPGVDAGEIAKAIDEEGYEAAVQASAPA